MKEVTAISYNTLALLNGNTVEPMAEVALGLSEIHYVYVPGSETPGRERRTETIRFAASPDTLRTLAEKFSNAAVIIEADVAAALNPPSPTPRPAPPIAPAPTPPSA